MFNVDPLVMKVENYLISATMDLKPQTDICVTVEKLGVED